MENHFIYAWTTKSIVKENIYKIGETERTADIRVKESDNTSSPYPPEKVYELDLVKENIIGVGPGKFKNAYELEQAIHKYLDKQGKRHRKEFYILDNGVETLKEVIEILTNPDVHKNDIELYPHQERSILNMIEIFKKYKECLLNHKPRSGKTIITLYFIQKCLNELIGKLNHKQRVLILTSYPILNSQWIDVLEGFKGFQDYQIIEGSELDEVEIDENKHQIYFISLQDMKGNGEVFTKEKFDVIRDLNFDLVVADEVHYGVETQRTEELLNLLNYDRFLGLSATPSKNLLSGRFQIDQIDTYSINDENEYKKTHPEIYGKYAKINYLMWELSEADRKELKSFSLEDQFTMRKLFSVSENGEFEYKDDLRYLFNMLVGNHEGKLKKRDSAFPLSMRGKFNDIDSVLMYVPSTASQELLKNLLLEIPEFADNYDIYITNSKINNSEQLLRKTLGTYRPKDGKRSMIIAVDQLTTGITLEYCDMVMFLDDTQSLDRYIQASYRSQTPNKGINGKYKKDCWVIDMNPARCVNLLYEFMSVNRSVTGNTIDVEIEKMFDTIGIYSSDTNGTLVPIKVNEFENRYYDDIKNLGNLSYLVDFNLTSLNLSDVARKWFNNHDLGRTISNTCQKLHENGIDKGKNEKKIFTKNHEDNSISSEINEIINTQTLESIISKSQLLVMFTNFKYSDSLKCLSYLEKNKEIGKIYIESIFNITIDLIDVEEYLLYIKELYLSIPELEKLDLYLAKFKNKIINSFDRIEDDPSKIHLLLNTLSLISDNMSINKFEQSNGEIHTPIELSNIIINLLPKHVLNDPNKTYLNPANGIGNITIPLIITLNETLKKCIPSDDNRLKHIIENMIYIISSK